VHYADVSFNTEIDTIKMLSAEAQKQNKTHHHYDRDGRFA
jgi:predicted amino acid racemase